MYLLGKLCAVCRVRAAVEVHHLAGRNAAARDEIANQYEDDRNWLPVCRSCHTIVDKQSPATWACAAKMMAGELDIEFLRALRAGKRFSFDLAELERACDDIKEWSYERKDV